MMKKGSRGKQIAILSLITGIGLTAQAATINWDSTPTTISGDSDVSTNGVSLWAYSLGDAPASTLTVNGVDFTGSLADFGEDTANLRHTMNASTGSAYFKNAAPINTLSAIYQDILESGVYGGDLSAGITLTNLTVGTEYEVQFWLNDSRSSAVGKVATISDTAITLDLNSTDADGGVGQFIKGTFFADATSQSFGLSFNQLNAIQLRVLSEITLLSVEPTEIDLSLVAPETVVTGSVDVAFDGSAASVDIDVFVEGPLSSAFSVVAPSSFTLDDPYPSNSTVEIVFDNSTAGLVNGESATGMVNIVWNKAGSSEFTTNVVPMTVVYVNDPLLVTILYQTQILGGNGLDWNGAYWSNIAYPVPQIPTNGNTYVSLLSGQTRAETGTFLGDSLELRATGGVLGLKTSPVVVELILNAGTEVANYLGGDILNGSISSATNNGIGSITFSSGADNRNINIDSSMTIGSNIDSIIVNMGFHEPDPDEYVSVNNASNTYAGVWQVSSGHLVGNADGSLGTASFVVSANGYLDFNYDYDGTGKSLELASGGTLLLDQDLVFEQANLGAYPLDSGIYTAAALLSDPIYSNVIDAASNPSSTLTVLSDPAEYKVAIFTFSETNGVSSDVFAHSDVGDWDLSHVSSNAAFFNTNNAAFNETANVDALSIGASASPVDGNYHSFSFAVDGLAPGATLNLNNLNLDYLYTSALNFQLRIYSSVTGEGTNTFTSADTPIYDTGVFSSGGGVFTDNLNVVLTNAAFQGLDNGDSIEFRFVLTDSSGSPARLHGIDNVVLTGWVDDGLGPQVGEISVGISGTDAVIGWSGEFGATYAVQYDDDLVYAPGWSNIVEGIMGIDGTMSSTNGVIGPVGFYRVIVQ
jgi:hypothetical protein